MSFQNFRNTALISRRSLVTILATVWVLFSFCMKNALCQSVATAKGPVSVFEASGYEVEFRNQSDASMQSLEGFHQVPLEDLPNAIAVGKRKPVPVEVRTQAKIVSGQLIGSSNLKFPPESANVTYTLDTFSPGLIVDSSSIGKTSFSDPTPVSHFDRSGNAAYLLRDKPVTVSWISAGRVDQAEPSRRIFSLRLPTALKAKFELTLDSQFELSSSNVPFALKQGENETAPASRTWELECGMVEEINFIVTDLQMATSRSEGVFGSEQLDWIVQSSGLELNASFVFDSTSTPKQISLSIDPRIKVRTITWDQQAINWSFDSIAQTISIDVPSGDGTYAGTQHRLLINGVSQWSSIDNNSIEAGLHQLPKIQLTKSLALEGRGSISLHSDWELVNFSANRANLVSRSGTTVRGGISRLDFSWRLSRPDFEIKLQRRKRLRTANVMMQMTTDRDETITTAKIRLNADSEAWSTLPIAVGEGWIIESCDVENASNMVATIAKDEKSQASNIVVSPPVENQVVELSLRLRSAASSDQSAQFVNMPQRVPLRLESVNQTSVLEYVPPSGYALEKSVDLVHESVNFSALDTWHQSQIIARSHAVELNVSTDLLSSARFIRQRPGIASRSILYVNKSWGATQCNYLLECTPDQAGIKTLDLQLPSAARNLIWRVLSKDRKEVQPWTWPDLTQAKNVDNQSFQDAALICNQLLNEPFILECQYSLPRQVTEISPPQIANLVNRNSYVLTDNGFQIKVSGDKGSEKALSAEESLIRPDEQDNDIRQLLSFIDRPIEQGALYAIEPQSVTFSLEASVQAPKVIIVDHSVETLYCQAHKSLLYELEVGLADLNQKTLKVSLPKAWQLVSAGSNETEFQYVVRDVGERFECELDPLSKGSNPIGSLKLRWLGPKVNLERGMGSMIVPDVQGNFQSISNTARILIHDNFVVPHQSSDWSERAVQNLKALSSPWNWARDFNYQSKSSSIDKQTEDSRLGYSQLRSQNTQGTFRNFANEEVSNQSSLPVANRRLVLLMRWIALAVSFIVATLLMRYSSWLAPWVLCLGLIIATLSVEVDIMVATAIGLILATIVQLAYVTMRNVSVTQSQMAREMKASNKGSPSGIGQKSLSAASVVRTVLAWLVLQNLVQAQGADSQLEARHSESQQSMPKVIVPVDVDNLRIAPYAWVSDEATQIEQRENDHPAEPVLLSAQHILECKKNQDVLFKFPQKALITSTYRFRFDDDTSSISLPFNISNVKLNQFSVDGKPLTYSQNFYYSNSGLVWKSQRAGEFTVEVKAQFHQDISEGFTTVRAEVLPCMASQISVQTDVSDLSLVADGRTVEVGPPATNFSLGKTKNLEMRWRLESTSSSIQYDAETRVFLDQGQPIAVTRIHMVGAMDRQKSFTLEWNRNWKPVGESFRDATKNGASEIWNIDYQRCRILIQPSEKLAGGAADLEIYWQPVNDTLTTLAVPDPRIVEAIPNVRSLRYAKSAKSIWSVVGTDAWIPLTSTSSYSLALPTANLANTTLLRVPETGGTATLQNNFTSQEKVSVQVHADYLIGSSSSSVQWRGSLVPSYVRSKTQSWIVDNRLTIDSIRINNQDALFAVDRFSDKFNLVRAIGDFEGELLSSVEMVARCCGNVALASTNIPLINWCNVKVVQSSFDISRLVGLPTTVENLPPNVTIDGRLFPISDSAYAIPFGERVAEGFESVPYELERPQIQNDQATVDQALKIIAQRDLAKVLTRASHSNGDVIRCQAEIALHDDVWRLDFNCELKSLQEGHGMVLALPIADASRIKSKASITKLGDIGDTAYLYLAAERDYSDETRLHRISFWIDQKVDSTKTSFDIPEIDFISAPAMRCDLNVSYVTQKQDLIWDVSHWTKQDASKLESDEATHASGSQLSRYVSFGKIAAIHAGPKPSTESNLQFPFAYWNLQSADDEHLVLEGLLALVPHGTASASLEMPTYLQNAAIIQISGDELDTNQGWILTPEENGSGGRIPIRFKANDIPQIIAVRGTVSKQALQKIEITDRDFQAITSDGKAVIPSRSKLGLSEDCGAEVVQPAKETLGVSNTIAMHSLTSELLVLLQDAKPNVDRLNSAQRNNYLSSWSRLIQKIGTSEIPSGSDVGQSDWIPKYRQIFAGVPTYHKASYIPDSFIHHTTINWRSIDDTPLKLEQRAISNKQEFAYDLLALCSWALPLLLMTCVMLPTSFSEQLRSILRDYPWRLLCLLALAIAIVPSLLWLSLLLSVVALIVCLVAFNRQYFGLS